MWWNIYDTFFMTWFFWHALFYEYSNYSERVLHKIFLRYFSYFRVIFPKTWMEFMIDISPIFIWHEKSTQVSLVLMELIWEILPVYIISDRILQSSWWSHLNIKESRINIFLGFSWPLLRSRPIVYKKNHNHINQKREDNLKYLVCFMTR